MWRLDRRRTDFTETLPPRRIKAYLRKYDEGSKSLDMTPQSLQKLSSSDSGHPAGGARVCDIYEHPSNRAHDREYTRSVPGVVPVESESGPLRMQLPLV